jgi:hypothetical protein
MTHLSVTLAGAAHRAAPLLPSKKTLPVATQSFAEQHKQAFAETLSKVRIDPKGAKLAVETTSSQSNVTRQKSATAVMPSATTGPVGFNALVPATTNAATEETADPAVAPTTTATPLSANDAYWAKQPAAVQQLRNIGDSGQRAIMAGQLAAEGYSIDVPVMVWGWDASKTTQLRQGFGYTWVPSAMQAPVSAAPGISGGAIIPYDPAHPPAGSILV